MGKYKSLSKKSSKRSPKKTSKKTSKRSPKSVSKKTSKRSPKKTSKKTSKRSPKSVTKKTSVQKININKEQMQQILNNIFGNPSPVISEEAYKKVIKYFQPLFNEALKYKNKDDYNGFLNYFKKKLGNDSYLYTHIEENSNKITNPNYSKYENIMEYLLYEILELSGSDTLYNNKSIILGNNIKQSIENDTELKKLFSR